MKVFITKYALTIGITQEEADFCSDTSPSMICVKHRVNGSFGSQYFHNEEWHETWEEAVKRAESMRKRALLSLDKKRKKLESMTFTPKTPC